MSISKDKIRLEITLKKNTFQLIKGVADNSKMTKSQVIENCIWLCLSDAINKDRSAQAK